MQRVILFLKGVCMGASDVIPGVSGGTMALILGIYRRLVEAIRGLHLHWVPPLWRWLVGGRDREDWEEFRRQLGTMDLAFLVTLGGGIVAAIVVGSVVIPELMAQFPVAMRAFFFGLIIASVWVPLQMIDATSTTGLALAVIVGLLAAGFGYTVTNPGRSFEATQSWHAIESQGESLERITRRGPSAAATVAVYWAPQNEALRETIRQQAPEKAETFAEHRERLTSESGGVPNKDELKKLSEPYQTLQVPEGTTVSVPRPAFWYVFIAGAIAICAMILPGISGSYILLILEAYFFVLNAVKGSIELLLDGMLPLAQFSFVALFLAGATIGILSFARLLSYLLSEYPTPTLAGLVGLMVGCLRGIWPFRATVDGATVNALPAAVGATVLRAFAAFVVGMAIVGALTAAGRYLEDSTEE
ncbi:MAG: DUF368 domain-containing protein [Bradymonadaceae bacterium]